MKRIEICGGIASGKTTLAKLIAENTEWQLALEDFRENPFWARFYAEPVTWVEEKNFCFVVQHTGAIKAARGVKLLVCDYAVFQDLSYARLVENRRHLALMNALYDHLYSECGTPQLVVHLRCSEEVQLQRIRARGRSEEANISVEYLRELNHAIDLNVQEMARETAVHQIRSDLLDFTTGADTAVAVKNEILMQVARSSSASSH